MRCIKCLNNLKKCRLISGLCLVLLSLSFCLSGLLSQSVSALSYNSGTETLSFRNNSNFSYTSVTCVWYHRLCTFSVPAGTQWDRMKMTFSTSSLNISDYQKFELSFTVYFQNYWPASGGVNNGNYASLFGNPYLSTDESTGVVLTSVSTDSTSDFGVKWDSTSQQLFPSDHYYSINYRIKGYLLSNFTSSNIITLAGLVIYDSRSSGASPNDFIFTIPTLNLYDDAPTPESQAIENQTEQQQQYHDETQQTFDDAQDTADTDSDSSSQQATSSGTTLLAGFTSFVSALTGATASNCVINADLGNMDLGSIDLCQLSPPPAFQAISSIMVIGFTVPLSIALAKKMISLFRSFQT